MALNTVLRNVLIGGIFLIPIILPFLISNTMFFPFITGKNFFFRILVELLFGTWIILALRDVRFRPTFSWILVSVTAFVVVIGLADLFGENPFKSFWSNFERMEGWVTLFHLLLYFLVTSSVLTTVRLWGWFAHISVFASIFMGLYGLFQLGGAFQIHQGGVRLDATLGNATYLAVYMLFHIFITVVLMVRSSFVGWMRYLYLIPIALQVFILYHTATRGAILGLLGGALLAALPIALFGQGQKVFRKVAAGALLVIILLVGGFFSLKEAAFVQDSPVLSRFANISLEDRTTASRFTIWSMALEGAKERPILGWGQENFNLVFNKYYRAELYDNEPWFDRVHNIVLDWLIAGGILGLIAYLLIPIVFLYHLWRHTSRVHFSVVEQSLWTGLGAAYFFHNLFVFDNITSYILFFSILAYVHAMVGKPASEGSVWGKPCSAGTTRVVVPLVIIAVVFSVYFFNWKGIATSRTLIQALSNPDVAARITSFERALAYDAHGRQEVAEQATQFAIQVRQQGGDLATQQQVFALAESALRREVTRAPDDARLRVFFGSLYDQYGLFDQAREQVDRAVELSPHKQNILHQAAVNRANTGQFQEAAELFQQAFELDTDFEQARILYAVGSLYTGEIDRADQLLAGVSNPNALFNNTLLINAYAELELYEPLAAIWSARVERSPEDSQARLSLAATYLHLEMTEEAVTQIEEAIRIDPNLAEQGNFFISEIKAGRNPVR